MQATEVDAAAADGSTALVLAASAGDVNSINVLLSAGAAVHALATLPDEAANLEYCAVIAAVLPGSAEVLQQLVAAVQLPPTTADELARYAIAAGQGHLLQQLFDAGADKGAALRFAATATGKPVAGSASALKVMQDLLAAGVTVDSADEEGVTPLMAAAAAGTVQAVQVLLAAGASVNARQAQGYSALCFAVGVIKPPVPESRGALVGLLIQAGVPASLADFREDKQQGRVSPLDLAVGLGYTAAARELCRHLSADGTVEVAELQDVFGTALRTAISNPCYQQGQADTVQVLLQFGADPIRRPAVEDSSVFDTAAVLASPAVIKSFLQYGSKQLLTTAVLLDAAVQAVGFHVPGHEAPPSSVQRDKALILVRAATDRSDPASVYAALQPGTVASSPIGVYDGAESLWPRLQGHFAQVVFGMCRGVEAQLNQVTEQRAVQQMCVQVAHIVDCI